MSWRSFGRNRSVAAMLAGAALCALVVGGARADDGQGATRATRTLDVDGRTRSYTLNLPPGHDDPDGVPLVIALHGGRSNAAAFEAYSRLTDEADAAGFAVVYPNGTSATDPESLSWNGGSCCGSAVDERVDDVEFIRRMLVDLSDGFPIDTRRVYATGFSAGGIMAYRLACELSDRVAAIAVDAAASVTEDCRPARPVSVLHMHSKLDENVPVDGSPDVSDRKYRFPPLATSIERWVALDGCDGEPERDVVADGLTRTTWSCDDGTEVQLLLTDGGSHAWPDGSAGRSEDDPLATPIDADEEAWAFLRRFALP